MPRSRVMNYVRAIPRVWGEGTRDSTLEWLEDSGWLLRQVRLPGTNDGTPNFTEVTLGPYAAKLSARVAREQFQQDREKTAITYQLAIASDEMPQEKDRVRIRERNGGTYYYRIEGTVNTRESAWGEYPVWNLEVTREIEY